MVVHHPPKELSSFRFSRIFHATHPQELAQITQRGIQATPWRIASSCYTWESGRVRSGQPRPFPGSYVWFSPEINLSEEQKYVCRTIVCKVESPDESVEFSPYIEGISRYGNKAISLSLKNALELYQQSLTDYYRQNAKVLIKLAGTKRYQRYVGYILIVCAGYKDYDPLPGFQNLTPAVLEGQNVLSVERFLHRTGGVQLEAAYEPAMEFHPKGVAVWQGCFLHFDSLEIAFHFPSGHPGQFCTPERAIRPQLNAPLHGCFSSATATPASSSQHRVTSVLSISDVCHTFCNKNPRCPHKTSEEEYDDLRDLRFGEYGHGI